MNTHHPVTPGTEPELDRWLSVIGENGEPAVVAEAQQLAARIVRRIRFLRCASPGSRQWVEAELDVLRRRLAVLASPVRVAEVVA
jgi:hypothetical protein